MTVPWQALRLILIAAAGAAYLACTYVASVSEHPPLLSLIVGLLPVAGLSLATAWRAARRLPALLIWGVGLVAVGMHLDWLLAHVPWLYFVQHAGTMALLAIMFGSTLGRPEDAICSRIALFALRSGVDAGYLRYTWGVTLAWTIFFVLSSLLSIGLFFLGSLEIWSLFATVLTPVLIGAMFVAEYLVRQRALPDRVHFSVV
jgi:uncharacterized membrane protein